MRQLVFASVPAGIVPGRSGYCTAARSPGLRDRLVRELELAGSHEAGEGETYAFRLVRIAGDTFPVITRYADAGPDYTGRASTIAHHLVFESGEIAGLPPPADIARRFAGWTGRWDGPARALPDSGSPELRGPAAKLPAETWKRLAGDAGKAALFCDDSGRAVAGKIPAGPTPADTLALLAELSLLTGDNGWTTPFTTREREPDAWAAWHATAATDAIALPSPGHAPRATYARAGAIAGAVPTRPGPGDASGKGRARRAAADTAKAGPGPDKGVMIGLVGGLTLAVAGGAIFLVRRGETPDAADTAPVVSENRPVAKPPPPEAVEALAALASEDCFAAAEAWLKLKEAHPADAADRGATILAPLQSRLVPATLRHATATLDRAGDVLPEAARAGIRKELATMNRLGRDIDAIRTPADSAAASAIESRLALMEKVAAEIPFCTVAETGWSAPEIADGGATSASYADVGETPALREFLTRPHRDLKITQSEFAGFGYAAEPLFTFHASGKDISPGRAIVGRDGKNRALFTLVFSTAGRAQLTRVVPDESPATKMFRDGLAFRIADPASGESHTLILLPPGSAPKPFALPRDALVAKNGVTSPQPWLARALETRLNGLRRPALLPSGYDGDSRQYPGLEADRSVLMQAPGARSGTPDDPVEAGSPWSIVVVPTGTPHPRRLIEFTAP